MVEKKVHWQYDDNSWAPDFVEILCRSGTYRTSTTKTTTVLKDVTCQRCRKKLGLDKAEELLGEVE